MILRSLAMSIMVLGFYYSSECEEPLSISRFIFNGTYGSHIILTFGLLLEAGFLLSGDKVLLVILLVTAIALNIACAGISFWILADDQMKVESEFIVNKGVVSIFGALAFITDLTVVLTT